MSNLVIKLFISCLKCVRKDLVAHGCILALAERVVPVWGGAGLGMM